LCFVGKVIFVVVAGGGKALFVVVVGSREALLVVIVWIKAHFVVVGGRKALVVVVEGSSKPQHPQALSLAFDPLPLPTSQPWFQFLGSGAPSRCWCTNPSDHKTVDHNEKYDDPEEERERQDSWFDDMEPSWASDGEGDEERVLTGETGILDY
jgi:hypothetical protein